MKLSLFPVLGILSLLLLKVIPTYAQVENWEDKLERRIQEEGLNSSSRDSTPFGVWIHVCRYYIRHEVVETEPYRGHLIGKYEQGKKNGLWKYYYKETLIAEVPYLNGWIHGNLVFYKESKKHEVFLVQQGEILEILLYDHQKCIGEYQCRNSEVSEIIFEHDTLRATRKYRIGDDPCFMLRDFCMDGWREKGY
ncbi:hypothetical protein [Pontibacter sp. G13]|uniref:hypothetical protein n=1 Tax=Pontibacter sp. G13 TaxID=3074898 RepID=UPI00288A11FA|nr:hypothetical protein [Pontibacter sp. G13]WNJ17727.1 hypothetical protein RJD25_22985 [Pontibacter sp. G13]